jgi:hypothetical protein
VLLASKVSDPSQLAQLLVAADLITKGISQKIAALSTRGQVAREAILRDLIKEMKDDKEVDGSNYKNNKGGLLLTAYVNATLSKQGAERRALLELVPALEDARNDIGWVLNVRRARIKKVLKPVLEAFKKEIKK